LREILILCTALAALATAASAANAEPTVAAILAANHAATGDRNATGTVEIAYAYVGQGMTGEVRSVFDTRTGDFIDNADVGPDKNANGFDGREPWMKDISGAITPQGGGDTREVAVTEAYLNANLWWRPDRGGASIRLLPKASPDDAYDTLEVTPIGGKRFTATFDAKTYLLVRTLETQGPQTIAVSFSDYRTADGALVAGRQVIDDGNGPQFRQTMTFASERVTPRRPAGAFGAPKMDLSDGRIDNAAGRTTVPFKLLNNHIYVDVKVNGQGPYLFILDSGGHSLLEPSTAKALGVRTQGNAPGTGAGEGVVEVGFAPHVDLQVGDLVMKDQTVSVLPIASATVEGFDEQGMIGFEVLRRFVTEIDYGAHTVTFIDPAKFEPRGHGVAVPFHFYNHLPQVAGTVDGMPGRFDIDTGSRVEITLTKPFVDANGLVASHPKGVAAVDGWGVGGPVRSYVTRLASVSLGPVKVDGAVGSLAMQGRGAMADPNVEGNVGSGLLKRFVVTFDYAHQTMYLRPIAGTPQDVGVFDRAGAWINMSAHGFKVMEVNASGAAAAAGLKAGDEITAVDGAPAGGIPLPELRRRLRDEPAGTQLSLDVLSGDQSRKVTLTLKDQI
jgi:hypothetical protein